MSIPFNNVNKAHEFIWEQIGKRPASISKLKTKKKRFERTCKMSGIGYFIIDTLTGEGSNDFFTTISETKEIMEMLENSTTEEISKWFPRHKLYNNSY